MSLKKCLLSLTVPLAIVGFCVFGQNVEVDEDASTPPEFQRVLERGRIASIDKPEFVTASEAEVAADSWMLGVLIEGEARAYSLSLLNHHEVVNDVVGGKPVAAVWWPLANTAVVYSRQYQGRSINFEASGGLIDASLVMQDKETDTYWSIMKGEAIGGELEGSPLVELPVTSKVQWKDWLRRHPETLVLSVGGREDRPGDAYADYMVSDGGFMGAEATDRRLKTKEEIFAFDLAGKKFAVPFRVSEGGAVFKIGGVHVLLYRPFSSEVYSSTVAFRSDEGSFEFDEGRWVHKESGMVFSPESEKFVGSGASSVRRMTGFDTFWYTWSALNPGTEILSHPVLRHPDAKARDAEPNSR